MPDLTRGFQLDETNAPSGTERPGVMRRRRFWALGAFVARTAMLKTKLLLALEIPLIEIDWNQQISAGVLVAVGIRSMEWALRNGAPLAKRPGSTSAAASHPMTVSDSIGTGSRRFFRGFSGRSQAGSVENQDSAKAHLLYRSK